jgi:hypothetical protein
MRRFVWVTVLLGCLGAARAEVGLSASASASVCSKYVFRGQVLGPLGLMGDASLEVRPLPKLALRAYGWKYLRLDSGAKRLQEIDYDLSATYRVLPKIDATAGIVYYDNWHEQSDGNDTAEWYAGATLDLPGQPGLFVYTDYRNSVGTMILGRASHTFATKLTRWSLDVSGEVGLHTRHTRHGFNHAQGRAALTYDLGCGLSVGPAIDLYLTPESVDPARARPVYSAALSWSRGF